MADLVADELGKSNQMTRAQAAGGVGRHVGQDAQLVYVRVVFWVEAFYFRMKGSVGRVTDTRVPKVGHFLSVFSTYLR